MKKLLLLLPLALCGCALFTPAVPESRFTAQLGTNMVKWSNPKNFTCTNFSISIGPAGSTMKIGFASSVNDAGIINSGYAGQAAYIAELTKMIETVATTAAASGVMTKAPTYSTPANAFTPAK